MYSLGSSFDNCCRAMRTLLSARTGSSACRAPLRTPRLLSSSRASSTALRTRTSCFTKGPTPSSAIRRTRSEEHTSELQSLRHLVCRLLLEKTLLIQQEPEVHCVGQGACLFTCLPQILDQTEGIPPRFREHESKTLADRSIPISNGSKCVVKTCLQL